MALSLIPYSSSSKTCQSKHDVFLSFRGEDTRNKFTSHLHKALHDKQIETFIDDKLNRGDEISPSLFKAIEESRISIIIFSQDYAASRWCLEELVKILECRQNHRQIVIPVFYEIDPSHVRHQSGSFAVAFSRHQKRTCEDKVRRWKDALKEAANLSGFGSHSSVYKNECELIEAIVQDVLKRLNDHLPSTDTSSQFVGIRSKIKHIESVLRLGSEGFRSIGLCGIGGIGKTTLARAVFNKISCQFDGSHFIENVNEELEHGSRLNRLRQQLLSALLGDENISSGASIVGRRLGRKKFLIVFDDVFNSRQIESLIEGFGCFNPHSRIIITTRDKQVLRSCEVDHEYEVEKLIHLEALELFCRHAFQRNQHPTKDFMELSNRVTRYTGGVPLALKVLGSHLLDKGKEVWKSVMDKLETVSNVEIHKILKISYDGLDDEVKKILLDIGCFFKGNEFDPVKSFLDACGFHTHAGIDILINKSLIAISDNKITMHDLIQAMAKEIVRQECPEDPGKRSRLWHHEDICRVLTNNTGTEKIEGITLDMSKISDIYLNPYAFAKMSRLRVLTMSDPYCRHINKVHVPRFVETNFLELRYFMWHGCPIKLPLSSFCLENLVKLDMSHSKVKQLWDGCQPLVKLKEVDLSFSSLISCPDFSGFANLERLSLPFCKYLLEISPSIQYLSKLDYLQLHGCCSLKGIPDCSGLNSLKELHLTKCSNLEMLPEMPCNIEELWLKETAIEELPLSTENLSRLQHLSLSGCKRLKSLPSSICKWKSLQKLSIGGCSKLNQLPNDIYEGALESLEELNLAGDPISELPSSIKYLKNLRTINCRGCKQLTLSGFEFFPDNLKCLILSDSGITELPEFPDGCLCSLIKLDLSGTSLESIPASIINLSNLSDLVIGNCKKLKSLPKLQLGGIEAYCCTSLEVLPSLSFGLRNHIYARFVNCFKLDQNIFEDIVEDALLNIKQVHHHAQLCYPGSEIPKWFDFRTMGSFINVELPTNWFNNNFLGFAICVVVSDHPFVFEAKYSDYILCSLLSWKCNFKSKDGHDQCVWDDLRGSIFVYSNHVFVKSPFLPFSLQELLCYENEISFEFRLDLSSLKIEKCGVHLMFGEEVDGSSWVGEDEDVLSLANDHDNCEERIEEDTQLIKICRWLRLCV